MKNSAYTNSEERPGIHLDIPAQDPDLFRSRAVHAILAFLSRYHTEEFSITDLSDAVDYSRPSVSNAVDILAANDLVAERQSGPARLVRINQGRLRRPDDPILQIPQSEFHAPVRAAVDELADRLEGLLGVVLYGSVASGTADRRSDIDLWILVEADRLAEQRTANDIRQDLEDREFDTGRYAYEIDVEALPTIPNYADEIREILTDGLVLRDTEKFGTVRELVFHGDLDGE
jgi:predicted nucleotidyltransferase